MVLLFSLPPTFSALHNFICLILNIQPKSDDVDMKRGELSRALMVRQFFSNMTKLLYMDDPIVFYIRTLFWKTCSSIVDLLSLAFVTLLFIGPETSLMLSYVASY